MSKEHLLQMRVISVSIWPWVQITSQIQEGDMIMLSVKSDTDMAAGPGNLVRAIQGAVLDLHAAAAVGVGGHLPPQARPAVQAGLLFPVLQLHCYPALVALQAATVKRLC